MQSLICLCKCCFCFPCELTKLIEDATFPSPQRPLYEANKLLLKKSDLLWLSIKPKHENEPVNPRDCIPALYVRARRGETAKYTVIYSHGNAEDIGYEQEFARAMAKRTGMDFFMYEYPGYSLSQYTSEKAGKPVKTTETNVYKAVEAAWTYLVNEAKVPANRIILFGRSIGTGPTIHIASRRNMPNISQQSSPQNAAGVFLISPILSTIRAVCCTPLAYSCFWYDKFPNHSKIKHVAAPVAIMHSQDDEVVNYRNGVILSKLLGDNLEFEPLWMEQGGHNDIEPEVILKYFKKFAAHITSVQAPALETIEGEEFLTHKVDKPVLTDFDYGVVA